MSQYQQDDQDPTGKPWKLTRGPEAYLSPEERAFARRILTHVSDFPPEFASYIEQQASVNAQITRSQVEGLTQFAARSATVLTTEEVTSTSYTNPATPGPTISGLSDGSYILWFGFQLGAASNLTSALMSPSINSSTPSDDDAASIRVVESGTSRAVLKEITGAGNNNTVTMQYRRVGGTDGDFERRWLVVLKVSN